MLTFRPQKSLATAKQYFREHLDGSGYLPGRWFGEGVKRLGIDPLSSVDANTFDKLCENLHPMTGDRLTARHRDDRRVYMDFVLSPPKTVSILALVGGDDRITRIEQTAVELTMREMERFAGTRVRAGDMNESRRTSELVGAIFRHETSRALDPQIHTHIVTWNATWDRMEDRWKALDPREIADHSRYLTEVYRARMAIGLVEIGYRLTRGRKGEFEIAGVPREIIQRFSKRACEIEAVAQTVGDRLGHDLNGEGRALIARTTRDWKVPGVSPSDAVQHMRSQVTPTEMLGLHQVIRAAQGIRLQPRDISTQAAVDHAVDHLFERNSSVTEAELLQVALSHGRGDVELDALREELHSRRHLIRVGERFTTPEILRVEREMIARVNQQIDKHSPFVRSVQEVPALSEEQRLALQHILGSRDGVIRLAGGAGTGKTSVLIPVVKQLKTAGHPVAITAPTTDAVEVLRKDGFADARTIQGLVARPEQLKRGQVLLVDEANLLSVPQMSEILKMAQASGSRVILSGDTRQHHSVEVGDALRLIESQSRIKQASLTEIRRQKVASYKMAVAEIAKGNVTEGVGLLEAMGAVRESGSDHRKKLAESYADAVAKKREVLAVAPTWREIGKVTDEIRQCLRERKLLNETDSKVWVHSSLSWTTAQKRDFRNYRPGLVVQFHRPTTEYRAGESLRVVAVEKDRLRVCGSDRKIRSITRKQAQTFDVAEAGQLPICAGDHLLIQANDRALGLRNGQRVRVKSVTEEGSIALTNGVTLPSRFRAFTHGYCVTSHAAEGKTVDHVLLSMPKESLVAANREQFYVSVSRGRKSVEIHTDDTAVLRQSIQKSGMRLAATETEQLQITHRIAAKVSV